MKHRVVEFRDGDGPVLVICEVYYEGDCPVRFEVAQSPVAGQDYLELQVELDRLAGALKHPRLKPSDFAAL